ncbi:ABC transporter permease [Treponema socranskii]|uniref:ABC transporter, permease protein n=1 Tax=Treponema socranskii subsp. socranskii VPI DR56BR1116 = ATCC 35536 TaxID=1125725 RepID=A0ABP2YNH4_TRESO|nr:iron ABC transporter permease [Treponema socranskii]ERK04651.1 ABC transporter, permease protein [Treponema socranskii subsp. socranskii VPI DR56BR1116 = ATCC 35536]
MTKPYSAGTQSKTLERKKLFADPILITAIFAIFLFLVLFIVYPLSILLVDSVYEENQITLSVFARIFGMSGFRKAISNTLQLGFISGILATLIGFLFAYVDMYVSVGNKFVKGLFKIVSVLPVVSPPFVLSLSAIMLFGRTGIITRSLFNLSTTKLYGLPGICLVQTLTFFPVCYLMLKGLLKNIDPSLEEAARNIGASRWKVFTSVTLPLLLPGLGNAFLVTFIESVADFANPMIIGGNFDTLATSIYLQLTGAYDKSGATAMAVVLLFISMSLFIVEKYRLERKSVATLTGKASRERMRIKDKSVRVPLVTISIVISLFVIVLYVLVVFGSLFKIWGRNYSLSLKWYQYVFKNNGYKVFLDSIWLSLIASPITALISMIIAYLVVKRKFAGKGFMEFIAMLAMAVPGTVLGVGFIRGFNSGIFHSGFMQGLYGTGAILVIVFIVRSLPIGTRSGIAALRQIDKSIEESAYDLGADSFTVFTTVTLPLIKDSFFSGLVTTFVRSITAISAIILLVTPQFVLITVRINEHAEKGNYGIACAYATILIVITYTAITLMNLFTGKFGTSRKQK